MPDEQRPTKEFTTPVDSHVVVVKEYLTGRESREIENGYIDGAKAIADPNAPAPRLTGEIANQVQDKLFAMAVVSIDGSTEGIVDALLNMKSADYDFVVKLVNEVSKGIGFSTAEKKTS